MNILDPIFYRTWFLKFLPVNPRDFHTTFKQAKLTFIKTSLIANNNNNKKKLLF